MAWTALTYTLGSVLTATKMTQNQDNFTALAQGLSGAPAILKAALPNKTMYTDAAQTMTAGLRINAGLGVNKAAPGTGDFEIGGTMTAGSVPLARMGTVEASGNSSVTAVSTSGINLAATSAADVFYLKSIRSNSANPWTDGAEVDGTEVIVANSLNSFIYRAGSGGGNDKLRLVNGSAWTEACYYKVYTLTET